MTWIIAYCVSLDTVTTVDLGVFLHCVLLELITTANLDDFLHCDSIDFFSTFAFVYILIFPKERSDIVLYIN